MPMERVAMRLVRDCLRLKSGGVSTREIARRIGVAPSTVRLTLRRCEAVGLVWPLDAALTDTALEQRLFANAGKKQGHRRYEEPDWVGVHREMKRKHVTLSIIWEEYIERHPGRYRFFAVLRTLIQGVGRPFAGDDASDACRRRKAVCRLRGRWRADFH